MDNCTSPRFRRRRRRRVKLGLCASLLAPSSTTDWVSCNEEVANARAQSNLIQRSTQPVVPLYCHLMPFAELVLFCIARLSTNNPDNPRVVATLIYLKYCKSIQLEENFALKGNIPQVGNSGDSRTALIEQSKVLCSTTHGTPLTVWVKSVMTEYPRYPHAVVLHQVQWLSRGNNSLL